MVEVRVGGTVQAPVEVAFGYVNDYRNTPKYFHGMIKMDPVGERTQGLGATFDGAVQLGPKTLTSRVEVVRWQRDALIALKSIKGFVLESSFEFTPLDASSCEINAVVEYTLPGGPAGKLLGRVIEPFVKIAVQHTERKLVDQINAQPADRTS